MSAGDLFKTNLPGGGTPAPKVPNVQTLWFSYDAENRVQVVNGALVNGQIVVAGKQANSDVESYALHYDAAGRETELTEYFAPGTIRSYLVGNPKMGEQTEYEVDVSGWRSHQTKTTYDVDGRVLQVSELGRTGQTWFKDAPDPALTALSTVYYSTALGGSGYYSAGMLVTYRCQNLAGTHMCTTTFGNLPSSAFREGGERAGSLLEPSA
ncbi:hypothetical protein H9L17_14275 [Thermomonas brevis]|uniref:RHS repeat protein n=1 Tax=Thermomonas brevis TaxID=215691 RepID=A0A7G9QSJ1_9GAMM|nr:hypothetical protein [Thermomonas brevis]QNN46316.1 hypothetical protein H9L17_14275 [Thermomonas brevis]